jgi:hypothetical protein
MSARPNIEAMLDEIEAVLKGTPPKAVVKRRPRPPVLVCVDGKIVGEATVIVSSADPNWWRGMAVRRNGEIRVTIDRPILAEIVRRMPIRRV